jgi:hypothetical protein
MASVTGQAKPVSTTPVPLSESQPSDVAKGVELLDVSTTPFLLSESQPTQPRGRATTLMKKHAGFITFLPSTLELPNT